jgi:hypothetical protein
MRRRHAGLKRPVVKNIVVATLPTDPKTGTLLRDAPFLVKVSRDNSVYDQDPDVMAQFLEGVALRRDRGSREKSGRADACG